MVFLAGFLFLSNSKTFNGAASLALRTEQLHVDASPVEPDLPLSIPVIAEKTVPKNKEPEYRDIEWVSYYSEIMRITFQYPKDYEVIAVDPDRYPYLTLFLNRKVRNDIVSSLAIHFDYDPADRVSFQERFSANYTIPIEFNHIEVDGIEYQVVNTGFLEGHGGGCGGRHTFLAPISDYHYFSFSETIACDPDFSKVKFLPGGEASIAEVRKILESVVVDPVGHIPNLPASYPVSYAR